MNKKELLEIFIKTIQKNKLLTEFIQNIFDYKNLHDYNYIFRISTNREEVIIDIYDNISSHRFNRYIFDFGISNYTCNVKEVENVFVTKININNINWDNIKLHQLAYLFGLDMDDIFTYANKFLDSKYINILSEVIKKPI